MVQSHSGRVFRSLDGQMSRRNHLLIKAGGQDTERFETLKLRTGGCRHGCTTLNSKDPVSTGWATGLNV